MGPSLGQSIAGLGDINDDGFDDFVVTRQLEGSADLAGAALVFRGSIGWSTGTASSVPAITIARTDADLLPPGFAYLGDLNVAAGDVDDDGKTDLVVGHPDYETVIIDGLFPIQGNTHAHASVFYDVESAWDALATNALVLENADRQFFGTSFDERAGALESGALSDYNDDGIDDVWIGSSDFNGLINGFTAQAGRVQFIAGAPRTPLPDTVRDVFVNRGDLLVDPETGMPERFGDYRLEANAEDVWFRFTTGGDGAANIDTADSIRVSLNDMNPAVTTSAIEFGESLRLSLIAENGQRIATDQTLIDLRNTKAGTYYLQVRRNPSIAPNTDFSFAIEVDAPALGQSHRPTDRDRILGQDGDDRLTGGPELDVLRGGPGSDLFLAEREEQFDRDNSEDLSDPLPLPPGESNHIRLGLPSDTVVDAMQFSPTLRIAVADKLGHPVTFASGSPVLHQPWYASELAQIEYLELGRTGSQSIRWTRPVDQSSRVRCQRQSAGHAGASRAASAGRTYRGGNATQRTRSGAT